MKIPLNLTLIIHDFIFMGFSYYENTMKIESWTINVVFSWNFHGIFMDISLLKSSMIPISLGGIHETLTIH